MTCVSRQSDKKCNIDRIDSKKTVLNLVHTWYHPKKRASFEFNQENAVKWEITSKTALQNIKARKEKILSNTIKGSAIRFDHCWKIDGSWNGVKANNVGRSLG